MFGNKFLLLIGHKKNDIKNRLINLLHKISIMEKSIKGTRTEQNLLKSFAGESQARSRYTFFASVAKKGLSGNFWLVSFKISYLCLPLFYETRTTPSCHPSGCAYRQL